MVGKQEIQCDQHCDVYHALVKTLAVLKLHWCKFSEVELWQVWEDQPRSVVACFVLRTKVEVVFVASVKYKQLSL